MIRELVLFEELFLYVKMLLENARNSKENRVYSQKNKPALTKWK